MLLGFGTWLYEIVILCFQSSLNERLKLSDRGLMIASSTVRAPVAIITSACMPG